MPATATPAVTRRPDSRCTSPCPPRQQFRVARHEQPASRRRPAPLAVPRPGSGSSLRREGSRRGAKPRSAEHEILFQKFFKSVGPRTYAAQVKRADQRQPLPRADRGQARREDRRGPQDPPVRLQRGLRRVLPPDQVRRRVHQGQPAAGGRAAEARAVLGKQQKPAAAPPAPRRAAATCASGRRRLRPARCRTLSGRQRNRADRGLSPRGEATRGDRRGRRARVARLEDRCPPYGRRWSLATSPRRHQRPR